MRCPREERGDGHARSCAHAREAAPRSRAGANVRPPVKYALITAPDLVPEAVKRDLEPIVGRYMKEERECPYWSSAAWRTTRWRRRSAARSACWAAAPPSSRWRPRSSPRSTWSGWWGRTSAQADADFAGRANIDLTGLERVEGRRPSSGRGSTRYDLNARETVRTDLNVFEDFRPRIPESYRRSAHVFLGNIDPVLQQEVLRPGGAPAAGGLRHHELLDRGQARRS